MMMTVRESITVSESITVREHATTHPVVPVPGSANATITVRGGPPVCGDPETVEAVKEARWQAMLRRRIADERAQWAAEAEAAAREAERSARVAEAWADELDASWAEVEEHVAIPKFPPADFYDCAKDCERLTHTSPEAAVEYVVDEFLTPECGDVAAVIRSMGELTVSCFVRGVVSARDKERLAGRLRDLLDEDYADSEYADPDGGDPDKAALDAAMPHLTAAVSAFCAAQPVWTCEWIEEITLSAEQVEAMMRRQCAHWFEVTT